MFLWQVFKGQLSTNLENFCRGMCSSPFCSRCNTVEEVIPVLRDCPQVKAIWKALLPASIPFAFFTGSCMDWIKNFSKFLKWAGGTP
uniref:Transposon TX1 uncharacterized n=1 Tax=Rhizophora mucronata TaxID=61149 RepID=A0A2P2NL93_RHIMU